MDGPSRAESLCAGTKSPPSVPFQLFSAEEVNPPQSWLATDDSHLEKNKKDPSPYLIMCKFLNYALLSNALAVMLELQRTLSSLGPRGKSKQTNKWSFIKKKILLI